MALKRRSNRVASLPAKIQGFFATLRMTSNDEGKNNDNGTSRSLRDDNKKGKSNSNLELNFGGVHGGWGVFEL